MMLPVPESIDGQRVSSDEGKRLRSTNRVKVSCYECRKRKIKCDRVSPCKNCSSRTRQVACRYSPEAQSLVVTQSMAISNLRRQVEALDEKNRLLQEELKALKADPEQQASKHATSNLTACSQQVMAGKHKTSNSGTDDRGETDLTILGIEQMAISQYNNECKSLTHPLARQMDIASYEDAPSYPFPLQWDPTKKTTILLTVLPERNEIFKCLKAFCQYSQFFGFAYIHDDHLYKDVDRFLSDLEGNAERHTPMLAFLFTILAQGSWLLQRLEYQISTKKPRQYTGRKSDIYLSASKHALNLSSFTNRPTVLTVETLTLMCPYLINTGRFIDAYTLFGTIIRISQILGLHRNPANIPSRLEHRERQKRQSLWWWLLFADTSFSLILGRPLGIYAYGDCPPVDARLESESSELSRVLTKSTILYRQILGSSNLTNRDIDHFTTLLSDLISELPSSLHFSPQWLHHSHNTPPWPINIQAITLCIQINTYIVLLNRRWEPGPESPHLRSGADSKGKQTSSGDAVAYSRVITSCRAVLQAFKYLKICVSSPVCDWSICQCAYNAAIVLAISVIQTENFDDSDVELIEHVHAIFYFMSEFDSRTGRPSGLSAKGCDLLAKFLRGRARKHDPGESSGMFSFATEMVLGKHGMVLIEDPGLLDHYEPSVIFSPLDWKLAGIDQLRDSKDDTIEDDIEARTFGEPREEPAKENRHIPLKTSWAEGSNATLSSSTLNISGPTPPTKESISSTSNQPKNLHIVDYYDFLAPVKPGKRNKRYRTSGNYQQAFSELDDMIDNSQSKTGSQDTPFGQISTWGF